MPSTRKDNPSAAATAPDRGTRERLLEAAGEVFAAEGFRAATVRRICARAGANLAAVNYHFGDKAGLYREVLRYAFQRVEERHPVPRPPGPAAAQLRAFVSAFLDRLLAVGDSWEGRVMARELADPTDALRGVVTAHMGPTLEHLDRTVAAACPGLPPAERRLHVLGLLAQCLFFRHARPVLDILFGRGAYARDQVPALADHIVRVFLRGLGLPPEEEGAR